MKTTFIGKILVLLAIGNPFSAYNQNITLPVQPEAGPGGSDYSYDSVAVIDLAENSEGCWIFVPAAPAVVSAPVVVFTHGYGCINPMIYGQWIRHLVRKGNIVIYPRYQTDLVFPRPPEFAENTAKGIKKGLKAISEMPGLQVDPSNFALIGHSYGGVVNADLAVNWEKAGIPKPKAVMLCQPGTGPLKGGRLETYAGFPADIPLLIITGEFDSTVGDEFAQLVFQTAINTPERNLVRHFADGHGQPLVSASHHECYAIDTIFDNGLRNFSANRALERSKIDVVDYYCYWKLGDALLDCAFYHKNCEVAFGGTPEQCSLGTWSDGTPVRPLEVILPKMVTSEKDIDDLSEKQ